MCSAQRYPQLVPAYSLSLSELPAQYLTLLQLVIEATGKAAEKNIRVDANDKTPYFARPRSPIGGLPRLNLGSPSLRLQGRAGVDINHHIATSTKMSSSRIPTILLPLVRGRPIISVSKISQSSRTFAARSIATTAGMYRHRCHPSLRDRPPDLHLLAQGPHSYSHPSSGEQHLSLVEPSSSQSSDSSCLWHPPTRPSLV